MVSFEKTAILIFVFVFLPHEGFSVIKKEYDYSTGESSAQENTEIVEKSD